MLNVNKHIQHLKTDVLSTGYRKKNQPRINVKFSKEDCGPRGVFKLSNRLHEGLTN